MGKSIVIVGDTGSGKTSVLRELETWGFDRVVPFTTRPMRSDEFNSNEYNQVSDDMFNTIKNRGDFAEWSEYFTSFGKWQYGILKRDIQSKFKFKHNAMVMNPKSLERLEDYDLYVVRLTVPRDVLIERLRNRGDAESEYIRRLNDDAMHLKNADIDGRIDLTVRYNPDMTPRDIARYIVSKFEKQI